MRVLRDNTFNVFRYFPLSRYAIFPYGFCFQVNRVTQEHSSGLFLTKLGIQYLVPRRTDTADRALVHTISPSKIPHLLAPRQGRKDFADLSIPNLRARMAIPSQFPAVPGFR